MKTVIVSEEEIFGKKTRGRRRARAREGYFLKSFGELEKGNFVVHVDHGIGLYLGLERLTFGAAENDFLLLEYKEGRQALYPGGPAEPDSEIYRSRRPYSECGQTWRHILGNGQEKG